MPSRKPNLTAAEIAAPFRGDVAEKFPPILSPAQLAELVGVSIKTVYFWLQRGRLDGAFRKRGKHVLLWRDKALAALFNGKDWSDDR